MSQIKRFYIKSQLSQGKSLDITGDLHHYLAKVLRFQIGCHINLFNQQDGEWRCVITSLDKRCIITECLHQTRPAPAKAEREITLIFSPLKPHRSDILIEKTVELGVHHLMPVITEFTSSKINIEKQKHHIISAVQQSERLDLPNLHEPQTLPKLLDDWDRTIPIILALERIPEGHTPLSILKSLKNHSKLAFIVGAEGGFSQNEQMLLKKHDFIKPCSLGKNILRAETAAITLIALSNLYCDD